MRISEDRYDRDRQHLELALRFLTHEARTQTIRVWTGLTDDRIRKLYRSYLSRAPCYVPRHRGKSPHQSAYFMRSLKIQQETAVLASFFALAGLVPAAPSAAAGTALPDITRGNALCTAFETYAIMVPAAAISFEYAVFLAACLARGDQLRLGRCCDCRGIIVVERFPIREKRCQHCASAARLGEPPAPAKMAPMDVQQPNFFSGPYIDRRAEEREHPDWARQALADAQTLYLLGSGTRHLVYAQPEPRIAFLDAAAATALAAEESRLVLLGWFRERRCVLVELGEEMPPELPRQASFEELRPLSSLLAGEEAGLLAYARALSIWRARQRYCGACGAPTIPQRAGHCMRCSKEGCAQEFFPRLDPAIIVLVTDGERALLGRQATWPAGRYSTIAGFVEPGESLEDAVAREVMEETGVPVTGARYDSSQPWPFPASIMLGFRAWARPGSPVRLSGELEDARWFTRQEIRAGGATLLPFVHSISRHLIVKWLEEQPAREVATA